MRRWALFILISVATCVAWMVPAGASAAAFPQCPPVDMDTGCQFLITVTNTETTVASDPTQGPYEGSDDALIGIQNNSSHAISSIPLSAEETLFGFDEDGICSPGVGPVAPGCKVLAENTNVEGSGHEKTAKPGAECGYEGEVKGGKAPLAEEIQESCGFPVPAGEPAGVMFPEGADPVGFEHGDAVSGYEGPTSWFTGISPFGSFGTGSGVVNFSPALAPGQSTYFSLESPPIGGFGSVSTLSTTLSGGGQSGASITVVQGTAVTDSATLGGLSAAAASGSVSFNVYTESGCKTLATGAGSAALSNASAGPSSAESLAPGKYYWQASYGGSVASQPATSACGSEVLTVLAPTTTTTTQTAGGVSGSSLTVPQGTPVTDQAHIAGSLAASAIGTVTYTLYKDSKCTVPAGSASVVTVAGGSAGSSSAIKPAAGKYYWLVTYSGDGANAGSSSACGSEVLVVALKANVGLPSTKLCLSRRKFIAHPRAPKGVKLVHVAVYINGVLKSQGPLTKRHTTIDLVGLPKGSFKVAMVVTSSKGKLYEDVRTFHTCVPKKHRKK